MNRPAYSPEEQLQKNIKASLDKAEARLRKMLEITGTPVKPCYCVKEVATLLDVGTDAIYRLIKMEAIEVIRLSKGGGKMRIDFTALVDYIATEPDE